MVTSQVNLYRCVNKATSFVIAGVIAMAATAAMAQSPYGYGRYDDDLAALAPYAYSNYEGRNTGYGQGGTAGLYSTGANVGPGRAAMIHATGQ
jgi:hypothetical protein